MKSRVGLLSVLIALALVLGPLAALAQDDLELQEYVSEDGLLTVSYPVDWLIQENGPDIGLPGVIIANNEDALEAINDPASDGPTDDQQVIVLMLIPTDMFMLMGMPLPADADVEELTAAIVGLFLDMEPGTEDIEEGVAVSEVEVIELTEDLEAGYVVVTEAALDGGFIIFQPSEGVVAFVFAAVAPGGYDEALVEIMLLFAASIDYTGTATDLMNFMMGGPTEPAPVVLNGETLVSERCSTCHSLDRVENANKDRAGWTATVDRMISNGARLSPEERDAVIEYLVGSN